MSEKGLCPSAVRNPKSKVKTLQRSVTELIKEEELVKMEETEDSETVSTMTSEMETTTAGLPEVKVELET